MASAVMGRGPRRRIWMIWNRRSARRILFSCQAADRMVAAGPPHNAVVNQADGRSETMITLYGAGEGFGLPEVSPYVTKTEVQLKMAGLGYAKAKAGPQD